VVSSRNTSGAAVRGSSTRGGPATRAATGAKSGRGGAGTREEAGATLKSDSWVRSRQDAVALDVGCVAVRGEVCTYSKCMCTICMCTIDCV